MEQQNTKVRDNPYQILSDNGFQDFSGVIKKNVDEIIEVYFEDSVVRCSLDHRFIGKSGEELFARNIKEGDILSGKEVVSVIHDFLSIDVFDALNVEGGNTYFTNGILSHNCRFEGSSLTLISGKKLRSMAFIDPMWVNEEGLEIYEKPIAGHIYTCIVDTSRGAGIDYSAFLIIDMTEMPYTVAAKYRNNDITPLLYPSIVYRMCMEYGEAWLLVEINDVGAQVADIIYQELEYTNLLMVTQRGRKGQTVDGGFGKGQTRYGVLTSSSVKKIGCAVLKSLIEEDKLIIQDQDIIFELCTFVSRKDSFEAEPGQHDDLAICLVLFAWLTTQNYYKDLTDINIRTKLYKDRIKEIEEEMLPFGFGTDDNVMTVEGLGEIVDIDADGDVWFST